MPAPQPRTVTLPADQTAMIDTLIATGALTEAEGIRQGLDDQSNHQTRPAQAVFDELRAKHGIQR